MRLARVFERHVDFVERSFERVARLEENEPHDYLERHAVHKKSGPVDAAVLKRDVLPIWGARQAEDIRRRDVIALTEAKARSAPLPQIASSG